MSIGISGAGIGGLSLAIALARVGFTDVEVFEAAAQGDPTRGGAFLNISPNGVNALGILGLAGAISDAGFHRSGIEFLNKNGRVVGTLDSEGERELFGAENLMLRRADLHKILLDGAIEAGVHVTWERRIVGVRETSDRVEIAFTNGSTATANVLVACDGVHSPSRSHVVGDRHSPEYLGLVDVAGFSPWTPPGVPQGPTRMVFGRTAFFAYFITPGGETWWFSNLPRPQEPTRQELAATSPAEWLAEVSASHAGDPPVVSAILRSSLPPVGAWPMTDLPSIPTWHTDRVCLLGDAAHATSPSAGQGASLAIEDAIVLGHHIAHSGPTATAFAAFEADRRDRVESLIQTARRNGSNKAPGPIGGLIRDLLLPVFLHRGKRETVRAYGYRAPELVRV